MTIDNVGPMTPEEERAWAELDQPRATARPAPDIRPAVVRMLANNLRANAYDVAARTMEDLLARVEFLRAALDAQAAEISALKQDIAEYVRISAEQAAEIARLRDAAALSQAAPAEAQPDWGSAPPGSTHYQPHQGAYYKRVSASEWYVWGRMEPRELLRWLPSPGTSDSAEWVVRPAEAQPVGVESVRYDAGLLSDYGGGDVEWWQDYIRAELDRAHDFYTEALAQQPAAGVGEEKWRAQLGPAARQQQEGGK